MLRMKILSSHHTTNIKNKKKGNWRKRLRAICWMFHSQNRLSVNLIFLSLIVVEDEKSSRIKEWWLLRNWFSYTYNNMWNYDGWFMWKHLSFSNHSRYIRWTISRWVFKSKTFIMVKSKMKHIYIYMI